MKDLPAKFGAGQFAHARNGANTAQINRHGARFGSTSADIAKDIKQLEDRIANQRGSIDFLANYYGETTSRLKGADQAVKSAELEVAKAAARGNFIALGKASAQLKASQNSQATARAAQGEALRTLLSSQSIHRQLKEDLSREQAIFSSQQKAERTHPPRAALRIGDEVICI